MGDVFSIKNKVILITGGYGYLGKSIVNGLTSMEAIVYVLGRTEEKFISSFAGNYSLGVNLFFEYCDVADSASIAVALKKIFEKEGRIDVTINNAFYSKGQSPELLTDDEWETGIDGCLGSVFKCIREIIPYFKNMGGGKIINMSSMYGIVSPDFELYSEYPQYINPPHYGAAKAGILQLTRYYAAFLGMRGITVNAISPGPFPSMEVQKDVGFIEELKKKTCLGRIGSPEDLVGAIVFLASNASNFITGQNIIVDGGWTIR